MPGIIISSGDTSGGGGAPTGASYVTTAADATLTNEQLLSALIGRGVLASRPAAGTAGRLYYATDTKALSRDNGSSWDDVSALPDLAGATVSTYLEFTEGSAPGTPASGKTRLYALTGGDIYQKNAAGTATNLASGGGGGGSGGGGGMVRLAQTVLGASSATITLSSISGSYDHLVLYVAARCDNASVQRLGMQFNSDTASNYDTTVGAFNNTTVIGFQDNIAATSIRIGTAAPTGAPANGFHQHEVVIFNYASTSMTKQITSRLARVDANSSGNLHIELDTGSWRSAAAIASITLVLATGNFVAGTTATLYGISGQPLTSTGTYGSLPSAGLNGRIYLPTDGSSFLRDNGSAWERWGPIFPLSNPPLVSAMTWDNQGSGSATDQDGGLWFTPNTGGFRFLYKTAPATPYTLTVGAMLTLHEAVSGGYVGVGFRNSSGNIVLFYVQNNPNGVYFWHIGKWTNTSAFSAEYGVTAQTVTWGTPLWFQVADDGTNRICRTSGDGKNWSDIHSVSRTDFMTATQIGIGGSLAYAGSGMKIVHWKEA